MIAVIKSCLCVLMYGMTRIKYWPPIHWPPTTGVHNLLIFSLSLQSRCILQCDQFGCLKWQRVWARQKVIPRENLWVALLRTEKTPALQATFLSTLTTLPEFIISKLFLSLFVCRDNLGTRNCLANLQWGSNQQRKATVSIPIPWSKGLQCWRRAVSWL